MSTEKKNGIFFFFIAQNRFLQKCVNVPDYSGNRAVDLMNGEYMAITKLLAIKEKGGSKSDHLRRNLFYICDPKKTGNGIWTESNAGCGAYEIYQKMLQNKQVHGKTDKRQGYHYVISFPPDLPIGKEEALQVARDFVQELLQDQYYYCIAVHDDKKHLHAHVTFDSVNRNSGYKYHSPHGDWKTHIQPITDRICKKYGLPVLTFDVEETVGLDRGEWEKKQDGRYSWHDIVRNDIDAAISMSRSYEEFMDMLEDQYYIVRNNPKNLTLTPYGRSDHGKGRIRTSQLGEDYTKEKIIYRIAQRSLAELMRPDIAAQTDPTDQTNRTAPYPASYPTYGDRQRITLSICRRKKKNPTWVMTRFEKKVYHWWVTCRQISRPENRLPREECARRKQNILSLNRLENAFSYMMIHEIGDADTAMIRRQALEKKVKELEEIYNRNHRRIYREKTNAMVAALFKLQKEYSDTKNPMLQMEIKELKERIEEVTPLKEAIAISNEKRDELYDIKMKIREIRKEMDVVDDILRMTYDRKLPNDDGSRMVSEEYPDTPRNRILSGKYPDLHRVTINRILFTELDSDDYYITRIPGKPDAYVMLEKNDCTMYQSGRTLAAFLYDNRQYSVTDRNGKVINMIQGNELRRQYQDKTGEIRMIPPDQR